MEIQQAGRTVKLRVDEAVLTFNFFSNRAWSAKYSRIDE
jgi:hypothetical protein